MAWRWQIGISSDEFSTFGWYPQLGQVARPRQAPPSLLVQNHDPIAPPAFPDLSWKPAGTEVAAQLRRRQVPLGLSVYPFPAATDAAPLLAWRGQGQDPRPLPRRPSPPGEPTLLERAGLPPLLSWRGQGQDFRPTHKRIVQEGWLTLQERAGLAPLLSWRGQGQDPHPQPKRLVQEGGSWLQERAGLTPSLSWAPSLPPLYLSPLKVEQPFSCYPFGQPAAPAAPDLVLVVGGQVSRTPVIDLGVWTYPFPTPAAPVAPDLFRGILPDLFLFRTRLVDGGGSPFLPGSLVPVPGLTTWLPTYPDRARRGDLLRGAHPWLAAQNIDPIATPPTPALSWSPRLPDRVWGRVLHPQLPQVWTSTITLPPPPDDRIFVQTYQAPLYRRVGVGGAAPSLSFAGLPPPAPPLSWQGWNQDWISRRAFPLLPFEVDAAWVSQILIAQQLAWRGEAPSLLFKPLSWDHAGGVVEVISPLVVADGYGCVVLGLSEASFSQILQVTCGSLLLLAVQSSTITDLAICAS